MGFWDQLARATDTPDGCRPNLLGECTRKDWREYTFALRQMSRAFDELPEDERTQAMVDWAILAKTRLYTDAYPSRGFWRPMVPEDITVSVMRLREVLMQGMRVFADDGVELPEDLEEPRHIDTSAEAAGDDNNELIVAGVVAVVGVAAVGGLVYALRRAGR